MARVKGHSTQVVSEIGKSLRALPSGYAHDEQGKHCAFLRISLPHQSREQRQITIYKYWQAQQIQQVYRLCMWALQCIVLPQPRSCYACVTTPSKSYSILVLMIAVSLSCSMTVKVLLRIRPPFPPPPCCTMSTFGLVLLMYTAWRDSIPIEQVAYFPSPQPLHMHPLKPPPFTHPPAPPLSTPPPHPLLASSHSFASFLVAGTS